MTKISLSKTLGFTALFLAGGLMVLGTAADARGEGKRERPSFEQLDINGDGTLTLEEMQNRGAARFAAMDANTDGELSEAELIAAAGERAAKRATRMIERMDTNGNGTLSQAEIEAAREGRGADRAARRFERMDADGDGVVTAQEFADAPKPMRGKRAE